MRTVFWFEHLKAGNCLEDVGVDDRIILKWDLKK
jgi:hypothetical protein